MLGGGATAVRDEDAPDDIRPHDEVGCCCRLRRAGSGLFERSELVEISRDFRICDLLSVLGIGSFLGVSTKWKHGHLVAMDCDRSAFD